MAAPVEYYRVQDNSSATPFDEENGFVAKDHKLQLKMFHPRNRSEKQNLFDALDRHLDWYDKTPSPFISVYSDWDTAVSSAEARAKKGKRGVFIAHINVEDIEGLWYRCVPKLAEEVGLWIQAQALRNSKKEFVFLHHIPAEVVTEYEYFKKI